MVTDIQYNYKIAVSHVTVTDVQYNYNIIMSHVIVTDIQFNYNISCRQIPVCFGLWALSALDILLHKLYGKVRLYIIKVLVLTAVLLRTCVLKGMMLWHWASSSDILNNCSAFRTAGTACTTTHQTEALNLLTFIMQGKGWLVSNWLLSLFPQTCTHISVYCCSQT